MDIPDYKWLLDWIAEQGAKRAASQEWTLQVQMRQADFWNVGRQIAYADCQLMKNIMQDTLPTDWSKTIDYPAWYDLMRDQAV